MPTVRVFSQSAAKDHTPVSTTSATSSISSLGAILNTKCDPHRDCVGLFYGRARNISHLAASWHGVAYETIHSDIVQDLLRGSEVPQQYPALKERIPKAIEEVRVLPSLCPSCSWQWSRWDVLKRSYMIPEERVHIIVGGVDGERDVQTWHGQGRGI